MQPPLTAADRNVLKGIKSRRKVFARRYEQIVRLKNAIAALAENTDDPADVIGDGSCILDDPEIGKHLDVALCWLARFGECWHDRTKQTRAADAKFPSGNQEQGGP